MPKRKLTSNVTEYCRTRQWELVGRMKKNFEEGKRTR